MNVRSIVWVGQGMGMLVLLLLTQVLVNAQTPFNQRITNAEADAVLHGNYDPAAYAASNTKDDLDRLVCDLLEAVSPDSLQAYVQRMQDFQTRNTYADTTSLVRGIGAARRWAYRWFQNLDARREDRLVPGYLEFEMPPSAFCGEGLFRNIFAVLPGRDTANHQVLILEGHLDSRCEVLCDTACFAPGADDNASGSAIVMELARILSNYTFDHSILFLLTVGEEQGLFGAEAFADWFSAEGIVVRAVQNNDVTGGIVCGPSSSAPSCPFEGHVDSTSVRIFSSGIINSVHKDYARFMKAVYREKVAGTADVPLSIRIMKPEDRSGRGGDHIPFRENGFRAIRVCASNEHGDANTASASYEGRQHTTRDLIGEDFNADGILDTFYVDFRYLARNTILNGATLSAAALGPDAPSLSIDDDGLRFRVTVHDPEGWNRYRIGVRQIESDFEGLYETTDSIIDLPGIEPGNTYRVTAAAVNARGVPGLFAPEVNQFASTNSLALPMDTVAFSGIDCSTLGFGVPVPGEDHPELQLLPPYPNPVRDRVQLRALWEAPRSKPGAVWRIHDAQGRLVAERERVLQTGLNETELRAPWRAGVYTVSFWLDGRRQGSMRLMAMPE
jgi:hypothetical protein